MSTSLPKIEGADRFTLISKIGEGGMGVVYEAFDQDRGIAVALKTLRRASPTALYLFKQEFRSIAGISHPNLVALYELFAGTPENWFFTMQLLRGPILLDYLRANSFPPAFEMTEFAEVDADSPTSAPTSDPTTALTSPFAHPTSGPHTLGNAASIPKARVLLRKGTAPDPLLVRDVMRQIVGGVSALHAAGKLHRDIKPTNVIIHTGGEAKVLDFGLAVDEFALKKARRFDVVGTSAYMAPEQATGRPLSPASDWFAVGVMLYQALCGESPFHGSFRETTDAKLSRAFRLPSEVADDVDPALQELTMALLEVDPSARPDHKQILSMLSTEIQAGRSLRRDAHIDASFYGRGHEKARIEEAMAASLSGNVAFALVHGASGVGKSTLVQHYVQQLDSNELILRGRCYEQESVPYKAIDSAVDALCEHLLTLPRSELSDLLPSDISLLAQLFPVLNRLGERVLFPAASTGASDARRIRRRSVQAMREILGRLRRDRPVILTIDDLQWGDIDSISLLGEIFATSDPPPVLVLCTYRREYLDRSPCLAALFELQKTNPAIRWFDIAVEPFSAKETHSFAHSLLGDAEISEAVASRIAKESGGNPYFAVELARYASRFSAEEARSFGVDSLRIDNLLHDRIAALENDSRDLLEVVAVHSQPLAQADAYQAAGFASRDPAPLHALRLANLVRSAGFNQTDQVESFHDRVRDAVLQSIPTERRRLLHGALAATLEASERGDDESLALHHERAGNVAKAGYFHELAGDRAAAALAFDRAASHYRACLELLKPVPEQEAALRAKLAEAFVNSGRGVDAAREFEAAAHHTPAKARIELERNAAFHYAASGYILEGNAIFERVLDRVGLRFPTSKRTVLFSILSSSFRLRLMGNRFRERDLTTVSPATLAQFDAASSVAKPMTLTNTALGMNFGLLALLIAMRAGDPVRFVYGLECAYVLALQGSEPRRRAEALIEIARAIVARHDDPNLKGAFLLTEAGVAYVQAKWKECIRLLDQAEDTYINHTRGTYFHAAQVRSLQLYTLWSMGEFLDLSTRCAPFLEEAEQVGDLFFSANIRTFSLPLAYLAADRPGTASDSVLSGLRAWPAPGYQLQNAMAALILAWIAFYEGKAGRNLDFVDEQWRLIRANHIDSFDNMRATTLDFRCRTALAAANRHSKTSPQRAKALKIARECSRILDRQANPWGRASASVVRAALQQFEGDVAAASETFLAAANIFEEIDMMGYAWSARRRAGHMMGGEEGSNLVEAADRWFESQSILRPERFAAMHVGGFAAHELD
jgi:serine/threonine protein kinase/tetratricopeptide (TPR) repeat protein